jgi:hypothetical protein
MKSDAHLPKATQNAIKDLLEQRKSTLPVGSNPEYGRLTARINYLRNGPTYLYAWREKNAERIKYERAAGISYQTPKRTKPFTDEQRKARNEAVARHSARNPQRVIRQRLERTLLNFYRECAEGQIGKRGKRAEELLGCTTFQFREHIRVMLAKKGWLWSGWRKVWTMDHIIPVRNFKLPEQQLACWNYTNLRPLAKHLNHKDQLN